MEKEIVLRYIELALTNLHYTKQAKFNIEGEVSRLIDLYDEDQIKEKVKEVSFTIN